MLEVGTAFTVLILHMERPGELPKSRSEKLCFRPGFAACGPVREAQLFQTGEITQVNARQAHFGEGADYEGAKRRLVGRDRAGHDWQAPWLSPVETQGGEAELFEPGGKKQESHEVFWSVLKVA
jgi:hypothetical protein